MAATRLACDASVPPRMSAGPPIPCSLRGTFPAPVAMGSPGHPDPNQALRGVCPALLDICPAGWQQRGQPSGSWKEMAQRPQLQGCRWKVLRTLTPSPVSLWSPHPLRAPILGLWMCRSLLPPITNMRRLLLCRDLAPETCFGWSTLSDGPGCGAGGTPPPM